MIILVHERPHLLTHGCELNARLLGTQSGGGGVASVYMLV